MSGYRQQEREISGHTARARQQEVKAPIRSALVTGGPRRRNLEKSEVTSFMREIGLPQYAEVLRDHGFEDMETLLGIEEEHMRDIGMPAGHIVKLKRHLRDADKVTMNSMNAMNPMNSMTHVQVASLARPLQAKGISSNSNMTAVQISWQQVKQLGTDVVGGLFLQEVLHAGAFGKSLVPNFYALTLQGLGHR